MKKPILLSLLIALLLGIVGCANQHDSGVGEDRIHGSAGVRLQSRDTSHFTPDRAPY